MLTKNTDKLRQEVEAHLASDSIIQGHYWSEESGKGCFIGCLAHSDNTEILETIYGLPVMVLRIAESIFESLPEDEAKAFFAALPSAVGCDGKDLTRVGWQFLAAELQSMPKQYAEVQGTIDPVIAGMNLLASGKEWPGAKDAARAGAAAFYLPLNLLSDAISATSYAAAAALSAAHAASNAANATDAVADSALTAAAADAARFRQRDLLLRLISEAPVTN
jgi:hypothetical protein